MHDHRNKECQTTIVFEHWALSIPLYSRNVWETNFSRDEKQLQMDVATTGDALQGILRMVRNPTEDFLSNQLACNSMIFSTGYKFYLMNRRHLPSTTAVSFQKQFHMTNNDSINPLDEKYGLTTDVVSKMDRSKQTKDYNTGWRLSNEWSKQNKNVADYSEWAANWLVSGNGKHRSKGAVQRIINNIMEMKSNMKEMVRAAHENIPDDIKRDRQIAFEEQKKILKRKKKELKKKRKKAEKV